MTTQNPQMLIKSKKFSIGQVIYVFFPDKYVLAPFRIAEESVVRTMHAENVNYKVVYGHASNGKLIELNDVVKNNAQLFESVKEAHTALLVQAKSTIDKIVTDASGKAKLWYPGNESQEVQKLAFDPTTFDQTPVVDPRDGSPVVQLPDGTIARIKVGS